MALIQTYRDDVTAAEQQEDIVMQEADFAAAFEQQHDDHLQSMAPAIDMHAFEQDRYQSEMVDYLDREDTLAKVIPWDLIDQYEQSRPGQEWVRYHSSIIYGRLDTIELEVEWPGQGKSSTFRRLQYGEALKIFKKGEAPVFNIEELPVPQDVWPGLRYDSNGVFASTLRFRTKYKQDKPGSFLDLLPGELRQMIYTLVFADCFHKKAGGKIVRSDIRLLAEPNLSKAIPTLRPEIVSYYIAKMDISICVYSKLLASGYVNSNTRTRERAGRYGTGRLAIGASHWLFNVHADAVRFHSIMMRIEERDGSPLINLHLGFARNKKSRTPVVTTLKLPGAQRIPVLIDSRMRLSKLFVKNLVKDLKKDKAFPGFSFNDLRKIAHVFEDPEGLGEPKVEQASEDDERVERLRQMMYGSA